MRTLDFLVIGAQKCATTTLFELLRQHPELSLPLEKEVPYFCGDAARGMAWESFVSREFPAARPGQKLGKVTPQYMADANTSRRLAAAMPDCKLIAVLRDPVERTLSHYRMGLRRGTECRDADDVIESLLDAEALETARRGTPPAHEEGYESESDFYVAWSEYGRILEDFAQCFDKRQLLIVYAEELQSCPQETLERVLRFIGVATDFEPEGLGKVMHSGGGGNKVPHAVRKRIRSLPGISHLWSLVPPQTQGRLRFLYERWNAKDAPMECELSFPTELRLREHFARDLARLEAATGTRVPWRLAYGI